MSAPEWAVQQTKANKKSWLMSFNVVITTVAVRNTLKEALTLSLPCANLGKTNWLFWSRVYNVHFFM